MTFYLKYHYLDSVVMDIVDNAIVGSDMSRVGDIVSASLLSTML